MLGANAARAVLATDARRRRWDRLATIYWRFLRDVGCVDPVDWGITPEGRLPVREQSASRYGPRRLTRTVLQAMLDGRQAIYTRPRPGARACLVCINVNGPDAHALATGLINDHFPGAYHEPTDRAHHTYLIVETDSLLRHEFNSLLRDTEAALRNAIHRTGVRLELRGAFALPGFGGSLTPLPRLPARWDDFYRLASTPLYDTGDLRAILAAGGGIGLEPAPRADSPLPAPPPPAASRRTKAAAPQRPKSSRSRRRRRSVLRRHSGGSGAPRLVKFWIPHNLDVRRLLPRDLRRYTECANYLVHRIIYGRAMRQADRDGFVPLKVRYLRKVAPDRIEKRLRDALIDLGVIECDGIWQKGRKAMGYRMAEEYRVQARPVPCQDRKVVRRVLDTTGLRFRNALTLDVHRYLRAWYARLDIDVAGAQAAAKALPAQRRDQHETCIAMLADSCVRDFTFCPYGRIHTVVTRLHRKLRAFLHVDDEPLFNIDIANSQPLMLALLLTQYRRAGDRFFNMHTFGADAETLYLRLSPAENDPSARSGWFG